MKVLPNIRLQTLIDFAEKKIQPGSMISSDAYHSYRALDGAGYIHEYQVYNAPKKPDHLHWLHTVLSNVKAFVGGTLCNYKDDYLFGVKD